MADQKKDRKVDAANEDLYSKKDIDTTITGVDKQDKN